MMTHVYAVIECWCQDEGYEIVGIFDSEDKAQAELAAEAERLVAREVAERTERGRPYGSGDPESLRAMHLRILSVKRFPINRMIPPDVRGRILGAQDDSWEARP